MVSDSGPFYRVTLNDMHTSVVPNIALWGWLGTREISIYGCETILWSSIRSCNDICIYIYIYEYIYMYIYIAAYYMSA